MVSHSALPYRKAVVDTGPLFTALTFQFISIQPVYRQIVLSEHKPPLYAQRRERDFLDFFASIGQILFTSHVIGEIRSRRELKRPDVRSNFWLSSMDYLKHKCADERLLTLVSLSDDDHNRRLVCTFGPVDTGLIVLARDHNCVLLTDDNRLLSCQDANRGPAIELVQNLL
jgi:hypothetical protein